MRKSIIVGLSCAVALTSCGRVFKGTSDKKMAQQDNALAHKWETECASNDVLGLTHATRAISINVLGNFEKTENLFNSDKCEGKQVTYKVLGTYAALGSVGDDSDTKKINFTVNKAMMTPQSEDAAKNLNTLKLCGISDWKEGSQVDITGKDCKGFVVRRGDVIYDVYKVEDKNLFFGQKFFFLASDDVSSRPNDVDTDIAYKR